MSAQNQVTLYERLGGVYSIATVVDDFIDRIMVDPRLNANPHVDEAHHRVSPAGFKYLVTEMVCWATGGPQKYTGRSMRDSHQHLCPCGKRAQTRGGTSREARSGPARTWSAQARAGFTCPPAGEGGDHAHAQVVAVLVSPGARRRAR